MFRLGAKERGYCSGVRAEHRAVFCPAAGPRAGLRPFGEANLYHQLGLDPRNIATAGRIAFGEWRTGLFQRLEAASQIKEHFTAEACADLSGIDEGLAVRLIIADQQSAESDARAFGSGEAADNELLAVEGLDLDPLTAASRNVAAVESLANYPFLAVAASLLEKACAVPPGKLGPADALGPFHALAEKLFAIEQRKRGDVVAIGIDVKVNRKLRGAAGDLPLIAEVKSLLQHSELGAPIFIETDDLAVEERRLGQALLELAGNLRKPNCNVVSIAAEQLYVLPVEPSQNALAIKLWLENPFRIVECIGDERAEHRRHEGRQRAGL